MLELKNVLVVLDPDQEQQPALDKVLTLAKMADFNITLLSCEYTQYLVEGYYFDAIDLPRLREELLAERKAILEKQASVLRDNGLSVEVKTVWGHPAYEVAIREARQMQADLVIAHVRQHSAISRILLAHNDWQLVRCCPVPLLLVKEDAWQHDPVVLAAVDPKHARHKPSGLDHRVLAITEDLAKLTQGTPWAVHAYSHLTIPQDLLVEERADHEQAFKALMADFSIDEAHQVLSEEAAEFAIQATQKEIGADIVVMGGVSRSLLSDVFIGNTTERVLDFLECDVLIVKPEDFVSPVSDA